LIDQLINDLFTEVPALLITGPRATGKTTTAARHSSTVVHLDQPVEAAAFRLDPDAVLATLAEPVLLDEWQEAPEVLGAVKRAVTESPRPGRFILTGSVNADLEANTWPGTGRLIGVPLYGMSVREQLGRVESMPFIDRLASGGVLSIPDDAPDLTGYVDLALRGGFPDSALSLSEPTRRRWLESYVEQLVTRDVPHAEGARDPARMHRYLEAYALNSAGTSADATIYQAARINQRTASAYERALSNLFVVEAVPAWTTNRLKRLMLGPKRYVVDPALLGAILRIDTAAVLRDGNLLGRVIGTFVASQLRAEIAVAATRPRLYHLRDMNGRREVDVLAELSGQRVVAFEAKAATAPGTKQASHLVWLREQLGDRFVAGVVFHAGPRIYGLGDRIVAAPICALWG
jgi:hypothetical protein